MNVIDEIKYIESLPENDISAILNETDISKMEKWFSDALDKFITTKIITLKPSEWAEQKRILPDGLNRIPGRYSFRVNPYMVEPLNRLHPSDSTEYIDFMKGAQVTYTVGFLENAMGWIIDENPGPTLFITGDRETAEKNMELRIDRMIQEAGIGHKIFSQVQKKHNKKTGDTKSRKEFPGGFIIAIGPNTGSKLRNDSIMFLLMDEIDAAETELKNEGSWMSAAEKRTNSFEGIRKIVSGSTPLLSDMSRIWKRFQLGTQEYYNVACKKCKKIAPLGFFETEKDDGKFYMKWDKFEDGNIDLSTVRMICPHCGTAHKNPDKDFMYDPKNGAKWIATAIPKEPNRRSYHLSSLYAPIGFQSWESVAKEWQSCQGDVQAMQVFYNTVLGLPFENRINAIPHEKIMIRRSDYTSGNLPPIFKPSIYTIGVDVQGDRIEAQLMGFGRYKNKDGKIASKVSASITYEVLAGNPVDVNDKSWRNLADLIEATIDRKQISVSCIDSGYYTDTVNEFCSQYSANVYPIMGSGSFMRKGQVFQKYDLKNFPIQRVDFNTDYFKQEIYSYIQKSISDDGIVPHGYCFYPDDYPESFYKGLTSEYRSKEVDKKTGYSRWIWKTRSKGRRNEQLDTTVYAWGGLYVFAYDVCQSVGLETIDWDLFWNWCDEMI